MVVSSSTTPLLFLTDAIVEAVAQAIGNTLPAMVSALQSSNSQAVATAASSAVPVFNSSGFAASSVPLPSPLAQAGVSGLVSGAGRLKVPSFIPTFMLPLATSLPNSFSLVASSMSPLFTTGRYMSQADANSALPLPKAEKAFVVGPGQAKVPYKLVTKITSDQFIHLADLLLANLRSPKHKTPSLLGR